MYLALIEFPVVRLNQTLDTEKVCRPLMHELAPLAQQITHQSLLLGINVALG